MLYALLPLIQGDLSLTDAQAGRLASAFMIVYMVAAPPIGYLADRKGRKFWISLGIFLWSLATGASGMAVDYTSLFLSRAAVGIGESCYGAISPSFVAEHFPPAKRGWILALFSMAIPVGSALGYVAGGAIGEHWGWRKAFLMVGLPGLVLAALCARLKDPRGGAGGLTDKAQFTAGIGESVPHSVSALASYRGLFRIPSFNLATLAGAAMTFALGGFAVWMPSFFHRTWAMNVGKAGTLFGGITVVSGIVGSLAGGWISDWVLRFNSRAYFIVSGIGLVTGMPLAICSLCAGDLHVAIAALFAAEFFLFLNMGPLNAIIVAVTGAESRSMAFAANIFVIHALGDAASPAIIGAVSDRMGLKAAMIGASAFLGLAGLLCFWGTAHYDRDAARVQHA